MSYAVKLDKPKTINFKDYDPADTGHIKKEDAAAALEKLGEELDSLQEWLYAAQKHSVLIVLQGLDTAGKDGTIADVMSHVNPQGCAVAAFKVPTPEEVGHDFLWRIHKQTPVKGMITIFNRSHYEDVLVTRVHKLITPEVCKERYERIMQFETLLAENSTIILKFFLHISKDEQEERLLAREKDEEKAWKLSVGDWHERTFWNQYISAYEDALGATAMKQAPWYLVPSNHKWYRNLAIAEAICETLRPYQDEWRSTLKDLGKQRKAELAQMRAGEK